jgi:hypothetical protein
MIKRHLVPHAPPAAARREVPITRPRRTDGSTLPANYQLTLPRPLRTCPVASQRRLSRSSYVGKVSIATCAAAVPFMVAASAA